MIPKEIRHYIVWREQKILPKPMYDMDAAEMMMILAVDEECRLHGL